LRYWLSLIPVQFSLFEQLEPGDSSIPRGVMLVLLSIDDLLTRPRG